MTNEIPTESGSQTSRPRRVTARCVPCTPEALDPYRDELISIAKQAYQAVPTSEIHDRLMRYHAVILFFDGGKLIGYMFMTKHETPNFLFIGIRFTAILPSYQKSKVSQIVFPTFLSFLTKTLIRKITRFDRRPVIFFCRACNPFAYAAIHAMGNYPGGIVEPDLIRFRSTRLRPRSANCYRALRDEVGLRDLDVQTGIIKNGAKDSGILPREGAPRSMKTWKTSWPDYLNEGDELVITVPMRPYTVAAWLALAAQRLLTGRFGKTDI